MKKAVMYGAGNIGRGFIGQLFSQSGYEVVFIDVNTAIIDALNKNGKYPVTVLNNKETKEILINNVRAVNGMDVEKVTYEIATSDIMATAVGVNILPRIAGNLAEGIKRRWEEGNNSPLNIIICENLLDANHILAGKIKQLLTEVQQDMFDRLIGLVEASIGRMVPVMTPEMQQGNILRVCVEEYGELPVDKSGFKGDIPQIKNMVPHSPFDFYIQRKLFVHNMGHALTAYLGRLSGHEYIWQAIEDPYIRLLVLKAMQDSAKVLSREHDMDIIKILEHVDDLIYRFGNQKLGDTVERVGNDTKRKLSKNDRMVGVINLSSMHGIIPAGAYLGIAAGMRFDTAEGANSIYSMVQDSPESFLSDYCGFEKGSRQSADILKLYEMIKKGAELKEILDETDEMRRNHRLV